MCYVQLTTYTTTTSLQLTSTTYNLVSDKSHNSDLNDPNLIVITTSGLWPFGHRQKQRLLSCTTELAIPTQIEVATCKKGL